MALELRLSESSCCAAAEALAPGEADLQSLQRRLLLCRRMGRGGGQSPKTKTQSLAPADSPHTPLPSTSNSGLASVSPGSFKNKD